MTPVTSQTKSEITEIKSLIITMRTSELTPDEYNRMVELWGMKKYNCSIT